MEVDKAQRIAETLGLGNDELNLLAAGNPSDDALKQLAAKNSNRKGILKIWEAAK